MVGLPRGVNCQKNGCSFDSLTLPGTGPIALSDKDKSLFIPASGSRRTGPGGVSGVPGLCLAERQA